MEETRLEQEQVKDAELEKARLEREQAKHKELEKIRLSVFPKTFSTRKGSN